MDPEISEPQSRLTSFGRPVNVLVVGASGGIGSALVAHLLKDPAVGRLHAWSRRRIEPATAKLSHAAVDITDEDQIERAAETIDILDLVVVATGMLHDGDGQRPEKSWRDLEREALLRSYLVNAVAPALVAKHTLPRLPRRGRAVFAAISARVGSISDNRLGGWYGYRASKAALNQYLRSLSIELGRTRPDAICVGLHPGAVATPLSQPFTNGLAADRLFTPEDAAARLLAVIDAVEIDDSGSLFAHDGSRIDF